MRFKFVEGDEEAIKIAAEDLGLHVKGYDALTLTHHAHSPSHCELVCAVLRMRRHAFISLVLISLFLVDVILVFVLRCAVLALCVLCWSQ